MAKKVRCFQNLDGTVRVVYPNYHHQVEGETDDAFIARMGADAVVKDSTLTGLPFVDVDRADVVTLDRAHRHKWRITGQRVTIDPTVPDKPHPQQTRIDAINAATTVDELKAQLINFIKNK